MITLATLEEATAQEIFDQVLVHLLKQGGPSMVSQLTPLADQVCVYKSPDGKKCAAGCLIAPSEYKESFEGTGWSLLVEEYNLSKNQRDLIRELQRIHDDWVMGDNKAIHQLLGWTTYIVTEFKKVAEHRDLELNFNIYGEYIVA